MAQFLLSPSRFFNINFSFNDIVFLFVFYSLLILPWYKYKVNKPKLLICSKKELQFYYCYKYIGYFFLVINIIIIYLLSNLVTDYSAYKNAGDNVNFNDVLPIQGRLYFYYHWFSQTYLLMLPYHFYFLQKNETKEGLLAFVCSLNYVLTGFTSFSRSNVVAFVFVYAFLFFYFRKNLVIGMSKRTKIILLSFIIVIVFGFFNITMNRFAGDNINTSYSFMQDDRLIESPVLNSQLSYFSQWHYYTNKWVPCYDGSLLTNGSRGFPFIALMLSSFGLTDKYPDYMEEIAWQQFGNDVGCFLGIATASVYDYGIFFSFLLLFVYCYLTSKRAYSSKVSINSFMLTTLLLLIPSFGIFNSVLNTLSWHFSLVVYLFLLMYKYLTNPKKV